MQIDGGFIVLGSDNKGVITDELTERDVALLDEATVRPKLVRYLPEPFEIRCAHYVIDGKLVGIIYVAPNTDGFCIFKATGNHAGGTVFRAGEDLCPRGSSCEACGQCCV